MDQIERELNAVLAAGRAGRWAEYRRHFNALRGGLDQHMALTEETLQGERARLRCQLEILGAAAPEQDPGGCLAELEELAAIVRGFL